LLQSSQSRSRSINFVKVMRVLEEILDFFFKFCIDKEESVGKPSPETGLEEICCGMCKHSRVGLLTVP
jgi:hypothetical protein